MNTLLDIAIGLSVTYLFYALLCTVIVEIFAGLTHQRGAFLREGIIGMLGREFTQRLYRHPLLEHATDSDTLPPYISSRLFALALADLTTKTVTAPGPQPASSFVIDPQTPRRLRRSLNTLILGTQGSEIHVIDRFERWYSEMNNDLTGRYSRRARKWTCTTAIALTLISQVDSSQIAIATAYDSALRAGLAKAAQDATISSIKELGDKLAGVNLPIGWPAAIHQFQGKSNLDVAILVILKLLGWTATVLAVALGAPFWFEQLNRIMNVRLGAKKPTT